MDTKETWDREKAVDIIVSLTNTSKQMCKTMTNYDLFELGKKKQMWEGRNPFKHFKQQVFR